MADQDRKRKIRKVTYHGKELEDLCALKDDQVVEMLRSRVRRKFKRSNGIKGRYAKFMQKVIASKLKLEPGQRPKIIKTHLRNAIIMPKMVGGLVAVYNGKEFKEVEIKQDMIGRYLGEFSLTYKPTLRKANFGEKPKKDEKGKDKK